MKKDIFPFEIGAVIPTGMGHTNVHIVFDKDGEAFLRFCTEADEEAVRGTEYSAWCEPNHNLGTTEVKILFGEAQFDENAKMFDDDYQLIDDGNIQLDDGRPKTKFIYYSLDIRQSDISNTEKFVGEIPRDQDPMEYADEIASRYYGGEGEGESDGWYFDGGCVCVSVLEAKEIGFDEYETLKKFLLSND